MTIRSEPLCPICECAISAEYLEMHYRVDHDKNEVAHLLALIIQDDHNEWNAEAQDMTLATNQT